jgi:LysM repeat protein
MSLRFRLQEARPAAWASIAVVLAACAASQPRGEHPAPGAPPVAAPPPAGAAEKVAPTVPAGWSSYVVQPGDTLGQIAACRGVAVTRLAEANGIADPRHILAGARLRVPPHDRCLRARVASVEPTPPAAPSAAAKPAAEAATLERGRKLLEAARARYDAADFEGALRGAEDAVRAVEPQKGSPTADRLLARCHVVAALAAAGLEQRDRAIAEFRLAFALDPGLQLSQDDASPRIQELAAAARR